jgi:MFS superfamily sulfate permease-like transporter
MALNFYEKMTKKNVNEYKRKYQIFKHHAWAGLGFLAVLFAIRFILPEITLIFSPIIFILIVYILVALIFTYKYRSELTSINEINVVTTDEKSKNQIIKTNKDQLKIEKKKAKAEVKRQKKS